MMIEATMSKELLALKWPTGVFHNFYPSKVCMSLCGSPPYYRVLLTPDPEGVYWTWHSFERGTYDFTSHHKMGVEICFPYGTKAEEDRGRGKVIRVRVEELGVEP